MEKSDGCIVLRRRACARARTRRWERRRSARSRWAHVARDLVERVDLWRKTHPGLPGDVWLAPQKEIEAIYRQKYWDALRCDELPAGVDYAVFDYGVNSGIRRAAKVLQRLIGVDVDGEIGPNTIAAAKRAKASQLIDGFATSVSPS